MFPVAKDRTSTAATNTRNKARLQEKGGGEERQDERKGQCLKNIEVLILYNPRAEYRTFNRAVPNTIFGASKNYW